MTSLAITLILYYIIAIGLYVGIKTGKLEFVVTSKKDGSRLDSNTFMYQVVTVIYCFGWLFPALQLIKRRLFDGKRG